MINYDSSEGIYGRNFWSVAGRNFWWQHFEYFDDFLQDPNFGFLIAFLDQNLIPDEVRAFLRFSGFFAKIPYFPWNPSFDGQICPFLEKSHQTSKCSKITSFGPKCFGKGTETPSRRKLSILEAHKPTYCDPATPGRIYRILALFWLWKDGFCIFCYRDSY